MSVAGGVRRPSTVRVHGCEALQIFSKNANQWRRAARRRRDRASARPRRTGIAPAVSHASYLINLATTMPALRGQSIAAMIDELDRAHALGLLGVVAAPRDVHAGTEQDGCG